MLNRLMPATLVAIALFPFLYIVVPLIHLLQGLTMQEWLQELWTPDFQQSVLTSVEAALATTVCSVFFGLPAAYLLSHRNFFGKWMLESVFVLPLLLPPLVGGMGQLSLYGPLSLLGGWFAAHHIPLTNSWIGVVLAQTYITSPFLILSAKSGFEEIPVEFKEAARTQGANLWHVFWYISIPLARASILSGLILTFARAVGEFGATMIVSYHPYTIPVDLWVQFASGGLTGIRPIAVTVVVFAILAALFSHMRGSRVKT